MKERPFGFRDKIGYMLGDFGNDFTFLFASTYLMVFYTKVLGIDAAVVGVMFLAARFLDAFTDIGMGRLTDRSRENEKGRFRIWILRMCVPVAVSSFLMYQYKMAQASETTKLIYMYATYLLWGSFCYTAINIPYGSMASVISEKSKDRQSLSVYRSLGSAFASVAISAIVPLVIYQTDAYGNQVVIGSRFTWAAGVFSVLAVISYLLCYAFVTERVVIKRAEKRKGTSVLKSLANIFSGRALAAMIVISILMLCAMLMSQSLSTYLFADYFKNTKALAVNSFLGLPAALFLAALSGKLVEKFGRKELAAFGCLTSSVLLMLAYFFHLKNVWIFIFLNFFAGIGGVYLFNMMVWAMITDVIDDAEVRNGERDDGTIYGVYSFARKAGQALAGGLSGFVLSSIGYDSLAASQTERVKDGIYMYSTLFPAIIYAIAALLFFIWYPLSKAKVSSNTRELQGRRG